MTTETLTPEQQAEKDKELLKQQARDRTDLKSGAADRVPTGDELAPPPRVDPSAARKAIFNKQKDVRDREIATSEQDPSVRAQNERVNAALAGTNGAPERGNYDNTERDGRGSTPAGSTGGDATTVDAAATTVKVKVRGREIEVPKADVDAAGSVEIYQKRRTANEELAEARAERKKLESEKADFEKRQQAAAQGAPATTPTGSTPGADPTQQGGSGNRADVEARANRIVGALYSGDKAKAREAVLEILAATPAGTTLDPKVVAQQAADLLAQRAQQGGKPEGGNPSVDELRQVELDELNAMYKTPAYADVMNNADMLKLSRSQFEKLVRDPKNAARSWVDLGREAAKHARDTFGGRAAVQERKQGLPPPPSGNGRAPAADAGDRPATQSEHIARMQAARRGQQPSR